MQRFYTNTTIPFGKAFRSLIASLATLLLTAGGALAQGTTAPDCPPNIDFETGTLTNWNCYTGFCCPINTPTLSGPVTNRHVVVNSGTDPYGGFPVNPPANGSYSLKLGNNSTGKEAEKVRYYIHVPAGVNDYSLIYRYAVVFQNPNHTAAEQPRFEVSAYDSATNANLPCAIRSYVASSGLPGFTASSVGTSVFYLPWTTGTLDLSGMAGHTVVVDFASGDCSQGGHFGYGYVDMSCGLFQIATAACNLGGNTTLSAPPGYQVYTWLDSALTTVLGTGQSISIPTPTVTTTYKVVLVPYVGYGCPDTLETKITISDLAVHLSPDTLMCNPASVQLNAAITGGLGTVSYTWNPTSTLSCTACTNPIATPTASTDYILTVTDSTGCAKKDTASIKINDVSITAQNVSCYGLGNATATANIVAGSAPYTYSWNTTPVQTTATISNLVPGTYIVTEHDNDGCTNADTVVITQPDSLSATAAITNITCYNAANGTFTIVTTGGTTPYQYSVNASAYTSTTTYSALSPATYAVTIKDAQNCTKSLNAVITQPDSITASLTVTNVLCNGFATGQIVVNVTGGTTPYQYSLNGAPYTTSNVFATLVAGNYTVAIKDANNCSKTLTQSITEPTKIVISTVLTDILCFDSSTGSIIAAATGGVSPYTYAINTSAYTTSGSFTNLPAATYTVKVNDSNLCYMDTVVTLTQPTLIIPAASTTMPLCFGDATGSISITASGGMPGYAYALGSGLYTSSTSFSNIAAGTYVMHIRDANSCPHDTTVIVDTPPLLTFTTELITNKCFGDTTGHIIFTANGGTPGYQYRYNGTAYYTTPTIYGLKAGFYYVFVQDQNGCTKQDSVTITQPLPVKLNVWKQDPTCEGYKDGVISLSGTGGYTPYTYSRDASFYSSIFGFSGIGEGTYTYYVKDSNSCPHDTTVTFTGYPYIRFTTSVTEPSCYGFKNGTISFATSGGIPPLIFQKKTGIFAWQSSPVFDSLKAGQYGFQIKDSKGCARDTTLVVDQPGNLSIKMVVTPNDCKGYDTEGGVTAEVGGGTQPYYYLWNTTPVGTTNTITGVANGRYTVLVKDDHDCADSARALVAYDNCCTPMIPNAFTPNGDGRNDVFRLRYKGDITLKEFSIYNRYGQRIYSTVNIEDAWDGTFKGRPQEIGTYFYYTRFICGNGGNNEMEFKGNLELIK